MEIKTKKDEAFWKILNAAIELDYKKGHLKWTMTELSRRSSVTRSLIYYYFGRQKASILKEAVKIVGEEFVGLNERRLKMWKEGLFFESLKESHDLYQQAPYLASFYLNSRNSHNEIGESLRSIEKEFLKRIQQFLPDLNESQVRAIFSVYFGAVFSPFSDDEVLKYVVRVLKRIFGANSPYVRTKAPRTLPNTKL